VLKMVSVRFVQHVPPPGTVGGSNVQPATQVIVLLVAQTICGTVIGGFVTIWEQLEPFPQQSTACHVRTNLIPLHGVPCSRS